MTKETILTPVHEITFGLDNQLLKLSALNEVFNFVLAGMDKDSVNARKSTAGAVHFTTHYDGYSEMLYLVSSGLLECEATIEELLKRLGQEVRYDE